MIITTRDELKSCVVDGEVVEPVMLRPGISLMKIDFLTSLKNIACEGKFAMGGLVNVGDLSGIRLGPDSVLSGLGSVIKLSDFHLGRNSYLKGLTLLEKIETSFVSSHGAGLSDLSKLNYLSPMVMWPKGFKLLGAPQQFVDNLPEPLKTRLVFN